MILSSFLWNLAHHLPGQVLNISGPMTLYHVFCTMALLYQCSAVDNTKFNVTLYMYLSWDMPAPSTCVACTLYCCDISESDLPIVLEED